MIGWLGSAGRYRNEVHRAITVARLRVKDPEGARNLEADMSEAADLLEHAANLGMATMLLVSTGCLRSSHQSLVFM